MNQSEPPWHDKVRTTLDERARDLDGELLSGLNRARQNALDEARHASTASWFPAGLVAAAAVLALAVGLGLRGPGPYPGAESQPLEVALLTSDESLEMLEELEFYLWLDETLTDAG